MCAVTVDSRVYVCCYSILIRLCYYTCAVSVYSCAYVSDFLTQGYLYVSPNWFCFYANILGYKKRVRIPYATKYTIRASSNCDV